MNNSLRITLLAGSILGILSFPNSAWANSLLFNANSGNTPGAVDSDDTFFASIEVSAPTIINQIGIDIDLSEPEDTITYGIFSSAFNLPASAQLVLQTAPKLFQDDGRSFKLSDIFSPITLLPGTRYYIGGVNGPPSSEGSPTSATLYAGDTPLTQGPISNFLELPSFENFVTSDIPSEFSFSETIVTGGAINLQLYGPAIPEPNTILGLLSLSALAVSRKVFRRPF